VITADSSDNVSRLHRRRRLRAPLHRPLIARRTAGRAIPMRGRTAEELVVSVRLSLSRPASAPGPATPFLVKPRRPSSDSAPRRRQSSGWPWPRVDLSGAAAPSRCALPRPGAGVSANHWPPRALGRRRGGFPCRGLASPGSSSARRRVVARGPGEPLPGAAASAAVHGTVTVASASSSWRTRIPGPHRHVKPSGDGKPSMSGTSRGRRACVLPKCSLTT